MRNSTALPSDHRLTRFLAVVWLYLLRMAGGLLVGQTPDRRALTAFSRFVASFLLIRAARRIGQRKRPRPSRPANAPPGFARRKLPDGFALLRAALGARLHHALRGRSAFAHVSALIRAILHRDALVTQLVRRLRRGLNRLRPLVLVHACAFALAGPTVAQAPAANDSS